MSQEEIARLKQYCAGAGIEECLIIMRFCYDTDHYIADDMYYYLRGDVSYDKMNSLRYIPVSRSGFYERCSKALTKVRDYLQEQGRWG